MSLAQKKCEPCRGGIPPMPPEEARRRMSDVPGWTLSDDAKRISRVVSRKNFLEAMALVNRIADVAEAEGHHPDLRVFSWNRVEVSTYTHKIGGLHENDFILAAKINELIGG